MLFLSNFSIVFCTKSKEKQPIVQHILDLRDSIFMVIKKILLLGLFATFLTSFSRQSLVVKNPDNFQGLRGSMKDVSLSFKPVGPYIECGMEISFSGGEYNDVFNNNGDLLEVIYEFELPKNAVVTESLLWLNSTILKAKIRDLRGAITEYDGIVDRKKDPSILFQRGETDYELRVFPLVANETDVRKVKITYLLPVEWNSTKVSTNLSLDFLSSYNHIGDINIKMYKYDEWSNPLINLQKTLPYLNLTDEKGDFSGISLSKSSLGSHVHISYNNPSPGGIYLNRYKVGEQWGYYSLAVVPSLAFDHTRSRELMVVLDYTVNNTDLSKLEFIELVKSALKNSLNPSDRFNLILSGKPTDTYSNTWIEANNTNINDALNEIVLADFNQQHLLESLKNGFNFMENKGYTNCSVLCVSNTSTSNSATLVNSFIDELSSFVSCPINTIDFDTKKEGSFFFAQGLPFKANSLLYKRLAEISGGKWTEINTTGSTLPIAITETLTSLDVLLDNISISVEPVSRDDYTYDDFIIGDETNFYFDRAIQQVGIYVGESDLAVRVIENSLDNTPPTSSFYDIDNSISDDPKDSLTKKIWVGEKIRRLSRNLSDNDNATKGRIFTYSESEQILSPITAFLAIEPTTIDTVICTGDCSDPTVTGTQNSINTDLALTLAPNPVTSHLIINIKDESFKPKKIQIHDSKGVVVKEIKVSIWANFYEVELDNLQPGIYSISFSDGVQSKRRTFVKI